ncbi:MAG TPA: esterase-like activity of phytase family protein, partial [Rhizomicrobium sp.]|nr:esterase-like activity of phytase family protein [Rhizomicrobium sp.]
DYAGRLHRYEAVLHPYYGNGPTTQDQLTMTYKTSNLFREPKKNTTGLDPVGVRPASGNLPPLPIASNGKISVDDEGVVYPGDGTMWVSDEYGPYVYHYNASGKLIGAIRPPEAFIPKRLSGGVPVDDFSANAPPQGQTYNKGNPVSGRQNNQGAEGLAISPDGKTLFILLQSALIQDLNATSSTTIRNTRRNARLLAYDISGATPALTGEYVVQLPLFGAGLTAAQSELKALNDHQFLVLARDSGAGHGLATAASVYRSVDLIDITGATNIANAATGTDYDNPDPVTKAFHPVAPNGVLDPSITPVAYQKFLDINDATQLAKFGLRNGTPNDDNNLAEKWEALAVLPTFDKQNPNDYFLVVGSDNDFITQDGHMLGQSYADASGINNDSLVLVYRVTLPTYQAPAKH